MMFKCDRCWENPCVCSPDLQKADREKIIADFARSEGLPLGWYPGMKLTDEQLRAKREADGLAESAVLTPHAENMVSVVKFYAAILGTEYEGRSIPLGIFSTEEAARGAIVERKKRASAYDSKRLWWSIVTYNLDQIEDSPEEVDVE